MHSSAIKSKHSSSSVPGMNYILLMRLKYQWFVYSFIVAEGQLIKAAKTIALGSRDAEIHFAASEDRQASSDRQNGAVNMRRGNDDDEYICNTKCCLRKDFEDLDQYDIEDEDEYNQEIEA